MPTDTCQGRRDAFHFLHMAGRCILGVFLIYMGAVKALDPVGFLKLLREYQFLASPWPLNAVAALLPWFEICCGVFLLLGIAVRGASMAVSLMFIAFTAAILHRALALQSGLSLPFCAIAFDCGCGAGEVFACAKLAENAMWIALALWLSLSRHAPRKIFPWR